MPTPGRQGLGGKAQPRPCASGTQRACNAAAVHLYERAGFVRYGRLPKAILVAGAYHAKDQMTLDL